MRRLGTSLLLLCSLATLPALGFTGQSTGPHLHLHVADADATLGAEGLPWVLDRFEVLGRYEAIEALASSDGRLATHTESASGLRRTSSCSSERVRLVEPGVERTRAARSAQLENARDVQSCRAWGAP